MFAHWLEYSRKLAIPLGKSLSKNLMIGLLSMTLCACGSDEDELQRYIYAVKTRPAKPVEPIPEFEVPPKFTYPEAEKRRSPFKPIVAEQQENDTLAPNIHRPKQPLEAFPLDALKFVGILKEGPIVWGLISQPGGLVSRIKPGDYMGKNYGQVIRISEDAIQIEETIKVGEKWEKKMIILKLNTP
ncbi:pilus assembly protein PilP [Legionella oakridgensis]|uniref:pilus assembly protein PilP n=1 Tax=Legionella oakridgensis TaxID=29423 RepID=UPI0003DE5D8A|nr:pilus assembly protein PilP [Legionella oakridgensis]ETO93581.1 Tfp pilus assembly protein PilP [Legionella oakridgensis RV-2-2007]